MSKQELSSVHMDNLEVSITAKGKELLRHVLALVMVDYHQAIAYLEDDSPGDYGTKRLHMYWYYDDDNTNATKLPYPFNLDQCVEFVWGWLQNANYGPEPDIDGSCSRGWRIKGGSWAPYVIFVIEPMWAEHHK